IYDDPCSRPRLRGALGPDAPRDRPTAGEGRRARDRPRPPLRHVVQRRLEAREGARARRAGAAHAGRPRAPYRPRSGADPAHRGLGLRPREALERPWLLEFTWMSVATRGLESRVTVEMTPPRGATDLVLTHSGLPDDEMGRGHEEGWKHFTSILAEKIKGLR